jgi:hypothetical protein
MENFVKKMMIAHLIRALDFVVRLAMPIRLDIFVMGKGVLLTLIVKAIHALMENV